MGSYAAAREVGEFYAGDIMQKLGIERKNKPEDNEKPENIAEKTENQSKDLDQKA